MQTTNKYQQIEQSEEIKDIAFEAVKNQTHSANEVKQEGSKMLGNQQIADSVSSTRKVIVQNSELLANILQEEGIDYVD